MIPPILSSGQHSRLYSLWMIIHQESAWQGLASPRHRAMASLFAHCALLPQRRSPKPVPALSHPAPALLPRPYRPQTGMNGIEKDNCPERGSTSRMRNRPDYSLQGNAGHCLLNTPCEIPAASSPERNTQNHLLQVHECVVVFSYSR